MTTFRELYDKLVIDLREAKKENAALENMAKDFSDAILRQHEKQKELLQDLLDEKMIFYLDLEYGCDACRHNHALLIKTIRGLVVDECE